ncbi:unnamed protein product [Owenia fusiformis]|uniref:Uncharacterized protein n=1 Tax=Owenia fusiformis TaxID=6347 RepID=A0A8J1Y0F7_OWEFU|nr:unnamed protein product [Owenia fusiformis]
MQTNMDEKFGELSTSTPESSDHDIGALQRPKKRKAKSRGSGDHARGRRSIPRGRGRGASTDRGGARGVAQRGSAGIRGRGRGRGRRGRGAMSMTAESVDLWSKMKERRIERVQEAIDSLPEDEVRELLRQTAIQHPGVFHSVVAAASASKDPQPPSPRPEDTDIPWWCICTRCRWMTPPPHPTPAEENELDPNDVCCHMPPDDCLSIMPEFEAYCLDDMAVHMNMLYRSDAFGLNATTQVDLMKSKRHAAYRLFVLWRHGMLTQKDRRVVPSCCCLRIRSKFPDVTGHYTGFKAGTMF